MENQTKFKNLLETNLEINSNPTKEEIEMVANFIETNYQTFQNNFPTPSLQWQLLANMVKGGKFIYNEKRKVKGKNLDLGVRTYLATGKIPESYTYKG